MIIFGFQNRTNNLLLTDPDFSESSLQSHIQVPQKPQRFPATSSHFYPKRQNLTSRVSKMGQNPYMKKPNEIGKFFVH